MYTYSHIQVYLRQKENQLETLVISQHPFGFPYINEPREPLRQLVKFLMAGGRGGSLQNLVQVLLYIYRTYFQFTFYALDRRNHIKSHVYGTDGMVWSGCW